MLRIYVGALIVGCSTVARADIPPPPPEPAICSEIDNDQAQAQFQMFELPQHEALRDSAVYQAWVAIVKELAVLRCPPGGPCPARYQHLNNKLEAVKRVLRNDDNAQAIEEHKLCRQVKALGERGLEHGCRGLALEGEAPCLALPAVFNATHILTPSPS